MTEQPGVGPEQAEREADTQGSVERVAERPHVRTDRETAVDDALGTEDDPR
jgi:hypothetical protein